MSTKHQEQPDGSPCRKTARLACHSPSRSRRSLGGLGRALAGVSHISLASYHTPFFASATAIIIIVNYIMEAELEETQVELTETQVELQLVKEDLQSTKTHLENTKSQLEETAMSLVIKNAELEITNQELAETTRKMQSLNDLLIQNINFMEKLQPYIADKRLLDTDMELQESSAKLVRLLLKIHETTPELSEFAPELSDLLQRMNVT